MEQKYLGKISSAQYGLVSDYPFLMGLQQGFSMQSSGIEEGGIYTVNMSKECEWENDVREVVIARKQDAVYKLLNEAKVNYVSELLNKPVEVVVHNGIFKSFRILTEVL